MKLLSKELFWSYFIPILFVLMWSTGSIFNKIGLSFTTPFTFLFYRLIIASSFLFVIALITKAPWKLDWKSLKKIAATGLVLQFGYLTVFYYTLYNYVSPAIITIVLGLQPIFTAVILEFILKKNITFNQWVGSILGLTGVFLIVYKDLSYGSMTSIGFVFSIFSLIAITLGTLMQKSNKDMDLITGTAIQLAVSIIPTAIFNSIFGSFKISSNPIFLLSLLWVSLIVSVSAICIYYALLKRQDVIKTTNLFYLTPPITAVLCYFVFDEKLDWIMLMSLALIVLGMLITDKKLFNLNRHFLKINKL